MFSFLGFRKEKDADLRQLVKLFVLSVQDKRCENCNLETDNCRKLHFANQTICVCPKTEVVTFGKRGKRKPRK